jgi:D-amino-acid dehydrogenase
MSVIPPSGPGLWRKVPKFLADPLGPLAIRWSYLPRVLPWLARYLWAGWTEEKVEATARALARSTSCSRSNSPSAATRRAPSAC